MNNKLFVFTFLLVFTPHGVSAQVALPLCNWHGVRLDGNSPLHLPVQKFGNEK